MDRRKAARKAARTRASNKASWERYNAVDKPVSEMLDGIINQWIGDDPASFPRVHFVDRMKQGISLKHGVRTGILLKVSNGGKLWKVQPYGYKRPQWYHAGLWDWQ